MRLEDIKRGDRIKGIITNGSVTAGYRLAGNHKTGPGTLIRSRTRHVI